MKGMTTLTQFLAKRLTLSLRSPRQYAVDTCSCGWLVCLHVFVSYLIYFRRACAHDVMPDIFYDFSRACACDVMPNIFYEKVVFASTPHTRSF